MNEYWEFSIDPLLLCMCLSETHLSVDVLLNECNAFPDVEPLQ